MTSATATAIAPATVANVGPGFDVMGFALTGPMVKITATLLDRTGNAISITTDHPGIPTEPALNTASFAAMSLLAHRGDTPRITLRIECDIPLGSGLGSSAAGAVAGVMAVNALLGSPYTTEDLLSFAMDGEAAASGARHADNVAAALFGGFVVLRRHDIPDWIHVPVPATLRYVVVHPHCTVNTRDARRLLPDSVTLAAAVQQWANVATLIAALSTGDTARVGRAMEDGIVEPVRSRLIPGYTAVKMAAMEAGALGCAISGSGPAMLALTDDPKRAEKIRAAMVQAFKEAGQEADAWTGLMQNPGARVI